MGRLERLDKLLRRGPDAPFLNNDAPINGRVYTRLLPPSSRCLLNERGKGTKNIVNIKAKQKPEEEEGDLLTLYGS